MQADEKWTPRDDRGRVRQQLSADELAPLVGLRRGRPGKREAKKPDEQAESGRAMHTVTYHPVGNTATNMARALLLCDRMRTVLILLVLGVLAGLFVLQKRNTAAVPAPELSSAQPAAVRPVSEHNWAKHALDTTAKVKGDVLRQRANDETR